MSFGSADAIEDRHALANLPDAEANGAWVSVEIEHQAVAGHLAHNFAFVGPKGVGKTYQLLRRQTQRRQDHDVVTSRVFRPGGAFSGEVLGHGRLVPGPHAKLRDLAALADDWSALWEWALGVSIVNLLFDRGKLPDDHRWTSLHEELQGLGLTMVDPFLAITHQLRATRQENSPFAAGTRPLDARLETVFAEAANLMPPILYFVDNSDEFFVENPRVWQVVGAGLLPAVRMVGQRTGFRVGFFLSLRSEIWHLLKKTHALAGQLSDYVVDLQWDEPSLRALLRKRIQMVRNTYGARAATQETLGLREETDALLTLLDEEGSLWPDLHASSLGRPRDIISLANACWSARHKLVQRTHVHERVTVYRAAIEREAANLADLYLQEIRNGWPWAGLDLRSFLEEFVQAARLQPRQIELERLRFFQHLDVSEGECPYQWLVAHGILGWATDQGVRFCLPGDECPELKAQPALHLHPAFVARHA